MQSVRGSPDERSSIPLHVKLCLVGLLSSVSSLKLSLGGVGRSAEAMRKISLLEIVGIETKRFGE